MLRLLLIISLALSLCACSTNYKPSATDRAAGVGAVVGGGLGAIIGAQIGDPLSGIALGAVAGGTVGSMIGNQFQIQDEKIASQNEIIANQEKEIDSHKSEIEELRRNSQDRVKFSSLDLKREQSVEFTDNNPGQVSAEKERPTYASVSPVAPKFESLTNDKANEPKAAYDWKQAQKTQSQVKSVCAEGESEYAQAQTITDNAQKLYHLRRALRVCPEQAVYHNAIGEIYIELDRLDDAKFEFHEALRLDPAYEPARNNLNKIS